MSETLFIHEELMLLALKDQEGTLLAGTMYSFAIGGAVLAELLLAERLGLETQGRKERVVLRDDRSLGDPLLDDWLGEVRDAAKPRSAQDWVTRIAGTKELKHRVARQLCRRGVLRADEDKVLGLFTRKIYPEVDPGPEREVMARLEAAVFGEGDVDPRTTVLVAAAEASGILKAVFGGKRLKPRKQRLKEIARGSATGAATEAALEAMQAAVLTTTVIASSVATTTVINS